MAVYLGRTRALLAHVYLNGPWLGGYGFWEGMGLTQICTLISPSMSESFWMSSAGNMACTELIDRKISAFVISSYSVIGTLVVIVFYSRAMALLDWSYKTKPLMDAIRQLPVGAHQTTVPRLIGGVAACT